MPLTIAPLAASSANIDLLDKQALAEEMRLSIRSLEKLVKAGYLPDGVRIGRLLFWERNVIDRWAEKKLRNATVFLPDSEPGWLSLALLLRPRRWGGQLPLTLRGIGSQTRKREVPRAGALLQSVE